MEKKDIILYFSLNSVVFLLGIVSILSKILEGVGSSLIAAGIIGYVIFWATYINTRRSDKDLALLHNAKRYGIEGISERRLIYDNYAAARRQTKKSFDIIGFGLRNFIEDNSRHFNLWAKSFEMRILVVNPNSPYCEQRDYEENDPPGKIKQDSINAARTILELNNPRVKIKWYNAIPVTNMLRMDDIMWVGPYFIYERSRNAYVLKLKSAGPLFKQYLTHFERIWNDPELSRLPNLTMLDAV